RIAFRLQLRLELVAPADHQPLVRNGLQNLAGIGRAAVLKLEAPWRARLEVAFGRDAEPEFPDCLRIGQRRPQLLRRRANVGDVHELRLAHRYSPVPSSSAFLMSLRA